MALVANLEAGFGDGGFDLSVSVTGMGGALDAAAPPAVAVDTDALAPLLEGLADPDLDAIVGAIASAAGSVSGIVGLIPDGAGMLAPLRAVLAAVEIGAGLPGLADALADADAERTTTGIDAWLPALRSGADLLGEPAVVSLTGLLGRAIPGFDPAAVGTAVAGTADGVAALVGLVGALMSVESVTRELAGGIELTASFLDTGRVRADLARLEGWATTDALVDLVVGIDPDDPGIVDLVAGPLLDYAVTLRRLSEAVVASMAWGEATLVGLDVPGLVMRLSDATGLVREAALAPVRALFAEIRSRLDVLVRFDLPQPPVFDEFVAGLAGLTNQLAAALDAVDPTALSRPIGDALDTVIDPLRTIEATAHEVTAAAAAALGAVRQAVAAVDLRPITDAVGAAVVPITEALDALEALVAGVQGAVTAAAGGVDDVLDPVRDALSSAAELITSAFATVGQLIDDLHLDQLGPTLEAGARQVADAIAAAQLQPVFDAIVSALEVAADALSLTPRDLLPDDVRQALQEGCEALQAVQLEPTREALRSELQGLRDEVDLTVLDAVRDAQEAVVGFLDGINPRTPITELEQGPFVELMGRLREADLTAVLAPVIEAVDEARAAVARFDPAAMFTPVEDALDEVTGALRSFDPAELLAPIEDQLAAVRTMVVGTLDLDHWDQRLDAVAAAVDGFLDRLDVAAIVTALDDAHAALVASASQPATGPGPLGTVVAALVEGAGLRIRADALAEVQAWVAGTVMPSEVVTDRLSAALATVERLADAVAAVDLAGTVGPLASHHARLVAALNVHPETSLLRMRVDAEVSVAAPGDVLGPLLVNRDRYLSSLRSAATALSQLASASRSELDAVSAGVASAASPLMELVARLRGVLAAATGVTVEGRSLRDVLVELLSRLRPSLLLAPLVAALEGLRDRMRAAADQALIAPLRDGLDAVRGTVDTLDISFVRAEMEAARDDVIAAVDALRPTTLLGDVLMSVEALRDRIAGVDPLGPVRGVVDGLKTTIDTFEQDFRPTTLTGPALEAYDRARDAIAALAVDDVLQPVLSALDGIEAQLEAGMDRLIDALHEVQDACASGGPSLGAALGAAADLAGAVGGSVSVSGSFGL